MAKFYILSAILLLVAHGLAVPTPEDDIVYHCANGVDTCPSSEWTCCGPILQGVGGTCMKLKPGEVCAL
ncbi:hypothetical protein CPB84DRAFT_1850984 [Gymnopilus junonius]|uniref:Uncharacterized protein n=1 Tax=Gymnopilus junonius TaxID=109634 RepID=A0A9P5NEA1_GYMJU|nr:hypothetical protein CPB84DRAFT_1850984 [Gymnopilus junonius]